MKFNKKTLTESLEIVGTDKKFFTDNKKQNIVVSEEQLDRLLSTLTESSSDVESIDSVIKEAYSLINEAIVNEGIELDTFDEEIGEGFHGSHNPGQSAANGLENVINSISKAYDMVKDSDTRKKIENTLVKLNNFLKVAGEGAAAGMQQRAVRPDSRLDLSDLPFPELEESDEDVVVKESVVDNSELIAEDLRLMKQVIKPLSRV